MCGAHWRDATDSTCLQRYVMTKRCHLPYNFPGDWLISHSPNHWLNEGTMVEHNNEVIVPYVDWKRDDLDLSCDNPAVAIFGYFKGQLTVRGNYTSVGREQHSLSAYSTCFNWRTPTHGYIC